MNAIVAQLLLRNNVAQLKLRNIVSRVFPALEVIPLILRNSKQDNCFSAFPCSSIAKDRLSATEANTGTTETTTVQLWQYEITNWPRFLNQNALVLECKILIPVVINDNVQ